MSQVIQVLLIQMKNNKNKAKKNNQKQSNTVQDISARIPDFLADKKKSTIWKTGGHLFL